MTTSEPKPELPPEEQEFVSVLGRHYAPAPMTREQRVAFHESLETRLTSRPIWPWKSLALTAAATALGIWAIIQLAIQPIMFPSATSVAPPLTAKGLQPNQNEGLFLTWAMSGVDPREVNEALPEDYEAIAFLFLE